MLSLRSLVVFRHIAAKNKHGTTGCFKVRMSGKEQVCDDNPWKRLQMSSMAGWMLRRFRSRLARLWTSRANLHPKQYISKAEFKHDVGRTCTRDVWDLVISVSEASPLVCIM